MKVSTFLTAAMCALTAMVISVGCSYRANLLGSEDQATEPGKLEVTLKANQRVAEVGDTLHLTITAANDGFSALQIESDTAAPVIATLWRYDALKGWVRFKEFPASSARYHQQWTLERRSSRTFTMKTPVEADWPMLETLKLTAEVNGRPDVRPHVFVYVQPES